jgi:integrase
LHQIKSRIGKAATNEQLKLILSKASTNENWQVALFCAAVAIGSGLRGGEIRRLQLQDVQLEEGKVVIRAEIAKNRIPREPILLALAEWGLRHLLLRAQSMGSTEVHHYLLPLTVHRSRTQPKLGGAQWDVHKPMTSWVKSWRALMTACGMKGFRFHDLRHTFRTLGAQSGVPLEVMMAQLGHMDRQVSLDYVHIQQRSLQRAKQLIESEQHALLAAARGQVIQTFRIREDLISAN